MKLRKFLATDVGLALAVLFVGSLLVGANILLSRGRIESVSFSTCAVALLCPLLRKGESVKRALWVAVALVLVSMMASLYNGVFVGTEYAIAIDAFLLMGAWMVRWRGSQQS